MIEQLIDALSGAFSQVVDLVSAGFVGVFEAVGDLSSNIF